MPMECQEGKKKFLLIRILLPYDLNKVLRKKSSIYQKITKGKQVFENIVYRILMRRNFFLPSRHSFGILEMDFEGIFDRPIVLSYSQPSTLWFGLYLDTCHSFTSSQPKSLCPREQLKRTATNIPMSTSDILLQTSNLYWQIVKQTNVYTQ